jgi:hypothetical protein
MNEESPMPLPDFDSEKDFREKWIAPFLSKMGFILPKHVHGQDEQGKDFFFADHDRFGHLRIYSAQAKLGDIGTGSELTGLLDQIERSFEVTLKYHKGAHEQRIAAVYVMATGTISPQARERIWDRCRQRNFGENVYFMDGETLENLERHATFREDSELRKRLVALLHECTYNFEPANRLVESCGRGKPEFQRCRTLTLEEGLRNPVPESFITLDTLSQAWKLVSEINMRVVPMNVTYDSSSTAVLLQVATATASLMAQIRDACVKGIRTLDERYSLSLEVTPKSTSSPHKQ